MVMTVDAGVSPRRVTRPAGARAAAAEVVAAVEVDHTVPAATAATAVPDR